MDKFQDVIGENTGWLSEADMLEDMAGGIPKQLIGKLLLLPVIKYALLKS